MDQVKQVLKGKTIYLSISMLPTGLIRYFDVVDGDVKRKRRYYLFP